MKHYCHAHKCEVEVPPRLFMCGRHWGMLRRLAPGLARTLLALYRPGQERDKNPSLGYITCAYECVRRLAAVEYPEDVPGLERLHARVDSVLAERLARAGA